MDDIKNNVKLWGKEMEILFFKDARKFASADQLFYKTEDEKFLAFWPKGYKGKKSTLQSRNSLIGSYTEKWTKDLIQKAVEDSELFAIQGAICDELNLSNRSPADVVVSSVDDKYQEPEDIKLIVEVKMSITWNWELIERNNDFEINCIGNYKEHSGVPSLLRSDSMLKAIGKSINIRVSNFRSSKIPILIIGNTPITDTYLNKVDHLKNAGIVQGFWSINPKPLDGDNDFIKETRNKGFITFEDFSKFKDNINLLLNEDLNFFSSMKTKKQLGELIDLSNMEKTFEEKAEKFLKLINR